MKRISQAEKQRRREVLLANIQRDLPDLEALLTAGNDHWGIEDHVYRFYHDSFKVYYLQDYTERVYTALCNLSPHPPEEPQLNEYFEQIVAEGTGKQFDLSHNQRWLQETRPIVEAAFHAHYFLQHIVKYGHELENVPNLLPSGWAAIEELYLVRY